MANSVSDAGKSEYEIRKKMIEEGIISQMVTLPSNMFSTVTLPATLWFFDKHKPLTDKKDEILFIDARSTFTQVDRAHRKFSDEQTGSSAGRYGTRQKKAMRPSEGFAGGFNAAESRYSARETGGDRAGPLPGFFRLGFERHQLQVL